MIKYMKKLKNHRIISNHRIIRGAIKAPPSKSMMVRAVFAAMLSKGASVIANPSYCDDAMAAIEIARNFGCEIHQSPGKLEIISGQIELPKEINCNESALCLNLISMISSIISSIISSTISSLLDKSSFDKSSFDKSSYDKSVRISGEKTLLGRGFAHIAELINSLGGLCSTNNGRLPFDISGTINGGRIELGDSNSSQHISGLLFALPLAKIDSKIIVENVKSRRYIDLTLEVLGKFGIDIDASRHNEFNIRGGQCYQPCRLEIDGDWSGAAFMLVAGGIGGRIEVSGLDVNSNQPDRAVLEALELAGANISLINNSVIIEKNELNAFEFDASDCPDLFPPLAVLAIHCNGTSKISGIGRLANKESDRAAVLVSEFNAIGVDISIKNDVMIINGGRIGGGGFDSHGDHRIAMAGAIAGLNARAPVVIESPECVAKSYPEFFADLGSISVRNQKSDKT